MKLVLRYGALALLVAAVAIITILPLATSFVDQWSRRDIELRSRLVSNSIRDHLASLLAAQEPLRVSALLEGLALDERLLAAGVCDTGGRLIYASKLMPASFTCEKVARTQGESFSFLEADGRATIAGAFPVGGRDPRAHLILLHDMSFVERRGSEARALLTVALAAVALGAAVLTSLVSLLVVRGWLLTVRKLITDVQAGRREVLEISDKTPLGAQVRQVLRQLVDGGRSLDGGQTEWTQESLRLTLSLQLPDAQVIVVSNREPYIHNRTADGRIAVQTPASGLVSALEPVMRACGGTWIAHGSGSADRETVDTRDRIAVPQETPIYTLRRIWLTDEEQDGYYYGFANEGLWPLCHIAYVRPAFREEDWQQYRAVNRRFADAVVAEAKRPDPVVLVQDYHFALLPKMIRERLPDATIITFWHIPWPNSESFGTCPWKEEIIEGLLGSSILGFHTQFHCNNFLETVDRFMESRIDREHDVITFGGHDTLIRPYPISIEWPPAALDNQEPVAECRKIVRRRLGLSPGHRLGVGIERFDYTKGILDRMHAVDWFLKHHPDWRGRFTFVQVAAPTRSRLPAYQRLQDEAKELAEEINARHGSGRYKAILLLAEHHEPHEVFEFFRAADLCVVSSLHDGMNLVAKEFVASRDDGEGALILSSFTGASRELSEALIVNPYDTRAMGEAIKRALEMPKAEQRARMRLMRDMVRTRNVHRWAAEMLLDAAKLRQQSQILRLVAQGSRADAAA